ncbi:MAG: hypothetical protein HYZ34_07820 [Ignavibacteriae bacterium]|nr:hypothetical protein [Ignavibacteriota bacterium]
MKTYLLIVTLMLGIVSFHCDDSPLEEEPTLTLESPNGGERWQIGTMQTIRWSSANISGDVKIEISFDDGVTFTKLFGGTPNDGEERWYVTGSVSTQTFIRISSLNEPSVRDESDRGFEVFEILPGPRTLVATLLTSRSIGLQWQQQSTNELGFIVERKTGVDGVWGELARTEIDSLTFNDINLVTNRHYFYRVRAYSNDGVSGETNIVSKIIGWIQQATGTDQPLYGIAYNTNHSRGIAVGQNGILLRSTNGGDEWIQVASNSANALYGVSFANTTTGVVVGARGTILRTTDAGATWSAQSFGGSNYHFKGVDFAPTNTFYAVGFYTSLTTNVRWGLIIRSVDGGLNWSRIFEEQRYDFEDVSFVGLNVGTAVGSYTLNGGEALFSTTNGGQIWVNQSDTMNGKLLGVHFTDANNGTAVGIQGTIKRTFNGGGTWTEQTISSLKSVRAVAFTDALRGVVVGDDGFLFRTTDAGVTWISRPTNYSKHFESIYLHDANTQTIVGADGLIIRTDNGGM